MTLIVQLKTEHAVYMGGDGVAVYLNDNGPNTVVSTSTQKIKHTIIGEDESNMLGLGHYRTDVLTGETGKTDIIEKTLEELRNGIMPKIHDNCEILLGYCNPQMFGVRRPSSGVFEPSNYRSQGQSGCFIAAGWGAEYADKSFVKAFNTAAGCYPSVNPQLSNIASEYQSLAAQAEFFGYHKLNYEHYYRFLIGTVMGGVPDNFNDMIAKYESRINDYINDRYLAGSFVDLFRGFPLGLSFKSSGIDPLRFVKQIFCESIMAYSSDIGRDAYTFFGPIEHFGYITDKGICAVQRI